MKISDQTASILAWIVLISLIVGAYAYKFLKKYYKEIVTGGIMYWIFKKNKK